MSGVNRLARLYSTAGHAGASGYIAIMALLAIPSSFLGAGLSAPAQLFKWLLGVVRPGEAQMIIHARCRFRLST